MTDYTRDIGGSTTLMIRHYGNMDFDFFVKTGPQTYNRQQDWEWQFIGAPVHHGVFNMVTGGNWQLMGSNRGGDMGADFDVKLTIFNEGLGFPTASLQVHISLTTVPPPPVPPFIREIGSNYIRTGWGGDGGPGGASITGREVWWSYDGTPRFATSQAGDYYWPGLNSGTTYYFWARNANSAGWSGFSNRVDVTTLRVPYAPPPVNILEVNQTSVRARFEPVIKDGGTPIREWQIAFGLDPYTPDRFAAGFESLITELSPGREYFFWARARNDVGWGDWSGRVSTLLRAGAVVLVGNTWQRAVPYVKQGGTWQLAKPWTKAGGVWRETSS